MSGANDAGMRVLFEKANDAIGVYHLDGSGCAGPFVKVNDAAVQLYGYSREELAGMSPSDLTDPSVDPEHDLDQLRERESVVAESLHVARDGRRIPIEVSAHLFEMDGKPTVLSIYRDLTHRKQTETVQHEREERQEFLLKLSDALRAQPDEQSIKHRTVRMLAEHLGLDRCWISEVFEQQGFSTVGPEHHRPGLAPISGVFPLSDYPETMQQLVTQPMVIEDVAADPGFSDTEREQLAGLHLRALLVVPLRKGPGKVIWALAATMATPRPWTNGERALLEEVAERAWDALERARADEAVRKSEERLQLASDAADVATFIWYPEEDRTVSDEREAKLFGYPPDAEITLDKALDECVHPDYREAYREAAEAAVDPNGPGELHEEILVVHPDGQERWLEVNGQVHFENKPVRMAGTVADVTERKRRESNLAFLEEASQDLVGLTSHKETMTALGGKIGRHFGLSRCLFVEIDEAQEMCEVIYGWGREGVAEIIGKHRIADFISPEFQEASRAGETTVIRDVFADPRTDGEQYAAYGINAMVMAPLVREGRWRFLLGFYDPEPRDWSPAELTLMRELTERMGSRIERARAEEAIHKSEARLQIAADAMHTANFDWDLETDEVSVNDHFRSLFGYGEDAEVVGSSLLDERIHPDDRDLLDEQLEQAFDPDSDGRYEFEFRVIRPDGSQRWVHTAGQAFFEGEGDDRRAVRVFGAGNDVTEQKQRERQQEFLLKFSDDLRTLEDEKTIEETGVRLLAEFLRLDRAYVSVLYPSEDRAVVRAEQRKEDLASLLGEVRMSDFPETVRQIKGETLVINNIDSDARLSDFNRTSLDAVNLQAFVCASARKGERNVIWSLAAVSATPRTWTKSEVELIEIAAERIWAAVERTRVEEAMRQSEQKYSALFSASPAPFLILKSDAPRYTIIDVNDAYLSATMREREEVIGRGVFEAYPDNPDDPTIRGVSTLRASFERVVATREPDTLPNLKYDVARPDGTFEERRWTPVNSPVLDENGEVEAIIHNANDVTEQYRAEVALRENEERQAFLLKFSDALRAEPSADVIERRGLQMLCEYLKLDRCYIASYRLAEDRADITRQVGNDRVPAMPEMIRLSDFPAAFQEVFDRTLVIDNIAEAESLSDADRRNIDALGLRALVAPTLRRGENNPRWVLVAVSAEPREWRRDEIALIEEVTERTWATAERARSATALRESEQRLRDANARLEERVAQRTQTLLEQRGQLRRLTAELTRTEQRERRRLAQLLHDHLQQLLVAAKMRAGRAGSKADTPEATSAMENVQQLIDQSIEASRSLTTQLSPPVLHDAGLTAAFDWLARWMHNTHGLSVQLETDSEVEPRAEESRIMLFEATRELLFNVVKHSGSPQATLRTAYDGGHGVRISVRDRGSGFDVDSLETQGDKDGIGLLHVRERLRAIGGEMSIHSSPGEGTRVELIAPHRLMEDAQERVEP